MPPRYGPSARMVALAALGALLPRAAHGQADYGAIASTTGARVEIAAAIGVADLGETADARLGWLLRECSRVLGLSPEDSAAVVRHRPTPSAEADAAAAGTDIVRFLVLPAQAASIFCGESPRGILAPRGVRLALDSLDIPAITRVVVRSGDVVRTPTRVTPAAVLLVGPWGVRAREARALAVDVALDDLTTTEPGRPPTIEFSAWVEGDGEPERIVLPSAMVERLWEAALPARLARAGTRAQVTDPAYAYVDHAAALAVAGDSLAAGAIYSRALRATPCVTAAAEAPAPVRRLDAATARPAARCEAASPWRVALRGALNPGYGRPAERPDGPRGSGIPRALVAAGLVTGIAFRITSQQQYDRYLAANRVGTRPMDDTEVAQRYDAAQLQRTVANAGMTTAAVAWGVSVLRDVLHERRFARRLLVERGRLGVTLPRP